MSPDGTSGGPTAPGRTPVGPIPQPNALPLDWRMGSEALRRLSDRAISQRYEPDRDLPWHELEPGALTPLQRLGIAYWMALEGTFEYVGVPTFARAVIAAYEHHEEGWARDVLRSLTDDEARHDTICRHICWRMLDGFPWEWQPDDDLGRAAVGNLAWVQERESQYWTAVRGAYDRFRYPAVVSTFAVGEAMGTMTFGNICQHSTNPVFAAAFHHMARDEARHYALAMYLMDKYLPDMTQEERAFFQKNLRAGWVYFSVFLDEPQPPFWRDLPDGFLATHRLLEDAARSGGLAIPTLSARRDLWRTALLRIKAVTDRNGIRFPAFPELGLSGEETPIGEDDLVLATF